MEMFSRIYDNFLRRPRFDIYDRMLRYAIEQGYKFYTIEEFNSILLKGPLDTSIKYAILRHDIDTDPLTAYELFKIEKRYSIASTYYFRLNTIKERLIERMLLKGEVEISYHYEEIATYAEKYRIKSPNEIYTHMESIRELFLENLEVFRKKLRVASSTVASHGDFVNVHLKLPNWYLCNDDVRKKGGIKVEAYDPFLMNFVTCRIADLGDIDGIWTPRGFYDSVSSNENVIYILVHPRQWYSRIYSNMKADFIRIKEGFSYKLL